MVIDKTKTCCFTGHRPNALPWKNDEKSPACIVFRIRLKEEIVNAINSGYTHFISGMALGVDTLVAETVLELKSSYPQITLECAIPCVNQDERWNKFSKARYADIKKRADKITLVSEYYFDGCMQKRNAYMVDNSSMIIAGYSGTGGGTKNTLTYAYRKGLKVVVIEP